MKKPIIVTVLVTLLTVAAFVATFLGGIAYQKSINEQVKAEVQSYASQLKVEAAPSKQ